MKTIKHSINTLIWALVGLYLAIAVLINIPAVQSYLGARVASALSQKLNTSVSVGRVGLGFFNRIIVDDVDFKDQQNRDMLKATRVSAKIDYVALFQGRISITSAQLFGMKAKFYKASANAKPNFQFALDSLASKDTTSHTPLHLELRSLIVRHGDISYNQLDAPRKHAFDTRHLHIKNLSSHLILNTLQDDSINLHVKRLSLEEASGVNIESLTFKLVANNKNAILNNFELSLPSSQLHLGTIRATYRRNGKNLDPSTIQYNGQINESYITPRDLKAFSSNLHQMSSPVFLQSVFTGTHTSLRVEKLEIAVPKKGNNPTINSPSNIRLSLSGNAYALDQTPRWSADIRRLTIDETGLELLAGQIPDAIRKMKSINYHGKAGGRGKDFHTTGILHSGAGNANLTAGITGDKFFGHIDTKRFNLGQILNGEKFGYLSTNIDINGNVKQKQYNAQGNIQQIDYNNYSYHNVKVDGSYTNGVLDGKLNVDDPNLIADLEGTLNTDAKNLSANLNANIKHFDPTTVHLLENTLREAIYSVNATVSFTGNSLNTAKGNLYITNFSKKSETSEYRLDSLYLQAGNNNHGHYITMRSDFGEADVTGRFDYTTLIQSIKNIIASKLPSIQQLTPIKFKKTKANNFTIKGIVRRSDWLRELFAIPVELRGPMHLSGSMSSDSQNINTNIFAPDMIYDNSRYKNLSIVVTSSTDRLNTDISAFKINSNGSGMEYRLEASAADDQLASVLFVDNHARKERLSGRLKSTVQFIRGKKGTAEAHMAIAQSHINIGDSTLTIHPSTIVYGKNYLEVNNFAVTSGRQHIKVNGITTQQTNDSLMVDLNNVNVSYILNLVNFHTVEFSGYASGRAYVSKVFGNPEAKANLQVGDFRFQDGRMGTLHAKVNWNRELEEIDINAQAIDTMQIAQSAPQLRQTNIKGYVSPKRNYIDLDIDADHTRGEFIGTFCSSFMNHTDLTLNGKVRLWGDLGELNLTGQLVANGKLGIEPLNTIYTLRDETIRLLVNEIQFPNCTIYDRNGNLGIVTGSLYHDHLTNLRYNLNVNADNLLAYDWGPTYGSTFYGTVYGTGEVSIKGEPGELNIDVNVTPEKGSQVVYDVSSPSAIDTQEFIHWSSRDSIYKPAPAPPSPFAVADSTDEEPEIADIPTDIHINFLINTTPEATLKVIMDKKSGDYISLNGSGSLRASYYNKGDLDIFGNYTIDEGVYKLTIQNIIKKDFHFAQGSSIVFGGEPYDANLNLKAVYALNSVSLSDLQIGRSFSSNNIRVNCIMNITGTPAAPKVEFDLDMPTVGTDVKQMVYSLINSEEEMNQQVLYLLAVGRFFAQGSNNADANGADNRTSLAMQSILSGQITQQLNTVLSSVVQNSNWNFGADISTGDEGWNNAQYEGLLSGRMLNNRLLFDGQFGYRDNKNATTSFIGDFDLRYLITPNGNISIHVYNKANDRYFTRNSLNTQGVGFIFKRDFDSWKSLFNFRKKKGKYISKEKADKE
ncbi:MAG: translocation/assembly module TamB domain-containing protein [Prevotella sp.]